MVGGLLSYTQSPGCVLSHLSHVRLFVNQWTITCQAPQPMESSQARIPKWVAMPSSGVLFQIQGLNRMSQGSCMADGFFTHSQWGSPIEALINIFNASYSLYLCYSQYSHVYVFSKSQRTVRMSFIYYIQFYIWLWQKVVLRLLILSWCLKEASKMWRKRNTKVNYVH